MTPKPGHDAEVPAANGQVGTPNTRGDFPIVGLVVVALLIAFPKLPFIEFSVIGRAIQAGQFAIVTASLVVLTGWVGQISLGHAALVGIGAYTTGWAVGSWGLPFPVNVVVAGGVSALAAGMLGAVALRVRGLFLAVATLIFSWMADAFLFRIGTVVKHSFIEVAVAGNPKGVPRFDLTNRTTMFYVTWGVALAVLFLAANIRDSKTGRAFFAVRGSEIGAASLGVDVTRYKLLAFTVSGFLAGVSGSMLMLDARALSPDTFGFSVSLFYLALAVVGGLSSLGGAVASSVLFAGLNELFFRVRALGDILDLVSAALLAVVLLLYRGGLASVPATVKAGASRVRATLRARLPERVVEVTDELPRAVEDDLLVLGDRVLNVFRTTGRALGSAAAATGRLLPQSVRKRLFPARASVEDGLFVKGQAHEIRRPRLLGPDGALVELTPTGELKSLAPDRDPERDTDAEPSVSEVKPTLNAHEGRQLVREVQVILPDDRSERTALLEANNVTVRFGGLTAVNDASLAVREHEIVGLIGPNGAGKTTLFNAIAGLNNPTEGQIRLFGLDVTPLPVHMRAQLGVARTFQAIQLFPELDVFDNLLVATHLHNRTGFFRHAFGADSSLRAEVEMRERVQRVIEEFGFDSVAHRRVSDLPFGVLRMVEVARAMVTDFPLVMLDEPASGLDNSETDRLAEMLLEIRAHGVTLLLIEHDVRMVTSVSDYIYVINRGEIIAEGPPTAIQRDPAVMAAYLGQAATHTEASRAELIGAS
jgi:branched-chain amino acid transport system ATP-binding protein